MRTQLSDYFPNRFGIRPSLGDTSNPENIRQAIRPNKEKVHIETPGNPTTRIRDIAKIAEIAHSEGIILPVDSTWSGLTTQHPFKLGADLVMHSLSKYINGHGDALGGALLGPKALIEKIRRFVVKDMGGCISPFTARRIMRGSVTLPLQISRHSENALYIADFLENLPKLLGCAAPGYRVTRIILSH